MHNFSRRELLKLGAAPAAAELPSFSLHGCGRGSVISPPVPSPSLPKKKGGSRVVGTHSATTLPSYHDPADLFTFCKNFFCWVRGPPAPNRLYTMAASLDPGGTNGGPILQTIIINRSAFYGRLTYTTMPEQLQARGISWKGYSSPDEPVLGAILSDNGLSYFTNFQDPASHLHL